MEDCITREEHKEFVKRMEADNHRQNRRIEDLEENVRQIGALTVSVEKMAFSVENMAQELGHQGERLAELEKVPGRNWDTLKSGLLGALATAVAGGVIAAVINFI
ncbi:MAG: hypothetical protein HFH59_17545 [Lachnospiraceae bacterium]|jgi:uncharacterized protein YoxC|nr:hypothetical protein [Lachnospiraceae bacterium]MCI9359243.1 hypothetical protein [Lachnospiraceae bacterium]